MDDTANMQEWSCSGSVNKVLQGYLLSGFIAILGLMFIFVIDDASPDARNIGYIQMIFAGVIGALAYRGARNSSRILVMDNNGFSYRDWSTGTVPWARIATIDAGGSRINAVLRVTLRDSGAAQPVLKIPAGDLGAPLEEIIQASKLYLAQISQNSPNKFRDDIRA